MRLVMRAPALADFDRWAEVLCGPAGPHLGGPFDRDAAFVEFLAATGLWVLRGFGLWTVTLRGNDSAIGFVLLGFEPGDAEPELGYLFPPAWEGHGYACEAAEAVRDHARQAMRLPSLVSYVDPANARSIALVRRLGARRDGVHDGCEVWRHHPAPEARA